MTRDKKNKTSLLFPSSLNCVAIRRSQEFVRLLHEILGLLRIPRMTVFFVGLFIFSSPSFAVQKIHEVNYFASLRANETNVRAGPGQNYPIKFTFKLKGVPVQVISEYDNWNEIKDYEGQSGWVMQSLLTKKRTLLVRTTKSFVNLQKKNNEKSRVLLRLENNVVGDYLKCLEGWCAMEVAGKKGWVREEEVFGTD